MLSASATFSMPSWSGPATMPLAKNGMSASMVRRIFDVVSTPGAFAAENPDLVAGFLKVLNDENAAYAAAFEYVSYNWSKAA